MKEEFEVYEKMLALYLDKGKEALKSGLFKEPAKPEGYDDYKIEKDAKEYELHLQMFLDYGADAHARHQVGVPIKPATYDEYLAKQEAKKLAEFKHFEYLLKCFNEAKNTPESQVIEEPQKPEGYDKYKAAQEKLLLQSQKKEAQRLKRKQITTLPVTEGLLFDAEGIPQYLNADDHYNGIENPVWTEKHKIIEPPLRKEQSYKENTKNKDWHNYDEDGVPEFLTYADRYDGIANPEWLKKHGEK